MKHVNIAPDPTVATSLGHLKPKYRRKLYAKYGAASGVNPGLMWPSKEELQEKIADEEEWDPSLQAMLEDIAAKKEAQQALYKAKCVLWFHDRTVARLRHRRQPPLLFFLLAMLIDNNEYN